MTRALCTSLCALLVVGCASVESQYRKAVQSRNEDRIRRFIHRHPESPLIRAAAAALDTVRFERAAADTGVASLQRFVQMYPTSALAPNASLLLAERLRDREIARLKAQTASDPEPAQMVRLADLLRLKGDLVVADSVYRVVIERDPNNAAAHTGLAVTYLDRGMIDAADLEIETAQRLAPDDPNVLLAAGEYYRLVGRPDLAISALQRVLNAQPDNVTARMRLGLIYLDIGKNKSAVWEFLKVRELDPKNVPALYYLGVAYADQGDGVTAMRHLENYLNSPHTAEDADLLAKARLLYDRLKSEARAGQGVGGVIADPNNPAATPAPQGSPPPRRPPSAHGKQPTGLGPAGGGRGGLIRKGG